MQTEYEHQRSSLTDPNSGIYVWLCTEVLLLNEEVSKKKVVSVHIWQVYYAQVAEIPKPTRGPQIR